MIKKDLLVTKDTIELKTLKNQIDMKKGDDTNPWYHGSYHGTHGKMFNKYESQKRDKSNSISNSIYGYTIKVTYQYEEKGTGKVKKIKETYSYKNLADKNKAIEELRNSKMVILKIEY